MLSHGLRGRKGRRLLGALALMCLVACALVWAPRAGHDGAGESGGPQPGLVGTEVAAAARAEALDEGVLGEVTPLEACEQGELVVTDRNGMGARATWEVSRAPEEVARDVLTQYQADGLVSLGRADYLDLFGNVWGCVVSSPDGWSETVLVDGRGTDGEASCTVTVVRLGAGEAAPQT